MKKILKIFNKKKRNKLVNLIILSIFVLFGFQLFTNFSVFNNTVEPLYEIFDKQCNSIGLYEINEYTEILENNSEYLGYCVLDAYATSTTVNKDITLNFDSLFLNIPACKLNQNKTWIAVIDKKNTFVLRINLHLGFKIVKLKSKLFPIIKDHFKAENDYFHYLYK